MIAGTVLQCAATGAMPHASEGRRVMTATLGQEAATGPRGCKHRAATCAASPQAMDGV